MKKALIPLMLQDPLVYVQEELEKPNEGYVAIQEFFLDGPVSKRVAVIDIDPETGQIQPGAKIKSEGKLFSYVNEDGKDINTYEIDEIYNKEFLQVSIFATVLKTLDLFEKERNFSISEETTEEANNYGVLGRKLAWAFDGQQLFLIPRAGEAANAQYCRDTHSLEFFYFTSERTDKVIYTGLSREIVAHEAGHAIIDAIAPDIFDAYTPESLSIHEGLADIVALFMSFSSHNIRNFVLDKTSGSIREQSHFTNLAEEFAQEHIGRDNLRDFKNTWNLKEDSEFYMKLKNPHDLCLVLTGAIYEVIIKLHESHIKKWANDDKYKNKKNPQYSASGFALITTMNQMKRLLFRALDYLPPGEITFKDYGRAIVAADRVDQKYRTVRLWFANEFINRGIIDSKEEILHDKLKNKPIQVDFNQLTQSKWYAHEFANDNRTLLLIPKDKPFEIEVNHTLQYYKGKKVDKLICVFKVSWEHIEEHKGIDSRIPNKRSIKLGTTLVIDIKESKIISRLSNTIHDYNGEDEKVNRGDYENIKTSRDDFINNLYNKDLLKFGDEAKDFHGNELQNCVQAQNVGGILKIKGTAKSLHICKAH